MREFSEFEKQKIKDLIKSQKACIGDFIADSLLVDRGILIDKTKREISLIFPKNDTNALTEFFETLSLLDYLEKNRLIFVHKNPNPFPGNFLSHNWRYNPQKNDITDTNGNNIPNSFKVDIPTDVFDTITKYVNTFFHVGTELRKLVENNFETNEYKQLQEALAQTKLSKLQLKESYTQTSYSKYAFYVSLFALLLTILISTFTESKVKINEKQFNKLMNNADSINNDSTNLIVKKEASDSKIELENTTDSLKLDSIENKAQKPNNVYSKWAR